MDAADRSDANRLGHQLGEMATTIKEESDRRHAWAGRVMAWTFSYLQLFAGAVCGAFQARDPYSETPKWVSLYGPTRPGTALYDAPKPFALHLGMAPGRMATMRFAVSAFGDVVVETTIPGPGAVVKMPRLLLQEASTAQIKEAIESELRAVFEELRRPGSMHDYEG